MSRKHKTVELHSPSSNHFYFENVFCQNDISVLQRTPSMPDLIEKLLLQIYVRIKEKDRC